MLNRIAIYKCVPFAGLLTASLLAGIPAVQAQETNELGSVTQRFSYVVGLQLGQRLRSQGLGELDADAVASGIADVMAAREPKLSMEEMQQAATDYQAEVNATLERQAIANKSAEAEYLAANRQKEGVTELDTGLQYRVVAPGSGKQATKDSNVTVHYRGTLLNGKEFDSSYQRGEPAQLEIAQVIEGWQQVLPLMKEGDKWEVAIPAALAYGENGAGGAIGPNEMLLFEIELVSVN